jgi:RNA polymerase sigma-70 factor (ECF subfamily)
VKGIPNTRKARVMASTDAELLAAVSAGDLSALGTLYHRHARDVWRVLDRVTNGSSDVEDVLQTTFLNLPRLAARFDGRASSCRNWLCGVATYLALRHGRGLRRFAIMLARLGPATQHASPVNPESQASDREEMETLERAVSALSPKKRAVFVLVECEGLSHSEVADTLQIPLTTVRTRLFAAKDELRAALRVREKTRKG